MKPLIVSPRAAHDLDALFDYTEERWGLEQAVAYARGIRRYLQEICEGQRSGRIIPGLRKAYLSVAYQSHHLIYRETSHSIVLIRILHQRMNIRGHL